jgi:hypothetical protein
MVTTDQAIKAPDLIKESEGMLQWVTTMINMAREILAVVIEEIHLTAPETEVETTTTTTTATTTTEETIVIIENTETIEVVPQEETTTIDMAVKEKIEEDIDQILMILMGQAALIIEVKIEESKTVKEIGEVLIMEIRASLIIHKMTKEIKERDQSQIDEMSYNVLFVINQLKGLKI